MKSFGKGFLVGVLVLLIINFVWGSYAQYLTYNKTKELFEKRIGQWHDPNISEDSVNLAIAWALQREYGEDSLLITEIGPASKEYDFYVSGVRGTKECVGDQRVKKVKFTKGQKQYRIIVEYDRTSLNMITWTNDESPVTDSSVTAPPALKPVQATNTQPVTEVKPEQKDSINANNHNVGTPTTVGDYNNNSDV